MRRSLKIVLVASVVLNVVLISTAGGLAMRSWWQGNVPFWGQVPAGFQTHMLAHLIDDLPDTSVEAFRQRLQQLRRDNAGLRADIGANRRALRALLQQAEFDAAAYQRLTQAIQHSKQHAEAAYIALLGDLLEVLPVDERQRTARRLTQNRTRDNQHHCDEDKDRHGHY